MARNLKKVDNETQTLYNLEYGEKHSKTWKMRNAHFRNWNMTKKTETRKKKKRHKHFLTWNIARNNKNVENEKGTL